MVRVHVSANPKYQVERDLIPRLGHGHGCEMVPTFDDLVWYPLDLKTRYAMDASR